MMKIGEVVKALDISVDTLRYYEKIALLPAIARNNSGIRLYNKKNISQIKFIKRAQCMGFSLAEIAQLLIFRADPQRAKPEVKQLASNKLMAIESRLNQLQVLRNELTLLVNLCSENSDNCPILNAIDDA